jgi:hypothetical protein
MAATTLDVDDGVILLLGAPSKSPRLRDRIEGITRLEKLFFLFEHETDVGRSSGVQADFVAHNFGPFSAKIYQAVDMLAAAGLITDSADLSKSDDDAWETEHLIYSGEDAQDQFATRNFALTERGRRYYNSLIEDLPRGTETRVADLKAQFGTLPLRQLIRYVYEKPEYKPYIEKSVIADEVLRR